MEICTFQSRPGFPNIEGIDGNEECDESGYSENLQ